MNRAAESQAQDDLERLYRDLDEELARLAPRCELSGRCCDFPRSGLRLYATDLEVRRLRSSDARFPNPAPELCPCWERGLCQARDGRPLGCRVYFCDESRAAELEDLSARFHQRLQQVHRDHGVAYDYGPFLAKVRSDPEPGPD